MAIPKPEKYIADFEKLGFGMFVHWGLYSQVGKGGRQTARNPLKFCPAVSTRNSWL